ncbi:MAG: EsaB/YukD family protein [Naasia sp.]
MTEYTRLTIVGSVRRAEMVVPGDEAIGALIPRLMELLDEKPGAVSRPLTLVRSTGEQLDTTLSVSDQSVFDGETLRLLREDAAPPPPEVSDVTDVVAENHDDRQDRWGIRPRRAVAAIAVGSATTTAGLLSGDALAAPAVVFGLVWAVAVVAAIVAGRAGGRWLSISFTAIAVGISLPLAPLLAAALDRVADLGAVGVVLVGTALVWAALGLGAGAGLADRAAWWGGVIGALLAAAVPVLVLTGIEPIGAVGIGAVLAVLVCGLLPWYAMSASGLTGLDDQVVEGRLRRRDSVLVTVDTAYRTLTWATFAVSVPLAVTALTLLGSDDLWAVGLGAAVVIVIASRTRAMPLALQAAALWAAAGIAALGGALVQSAFAVWVPLAVCAVVAIGAVVAGAVAPPEHRRASLRRIGNLLEALSVAALLPVLVGLFGVYSDLLAAF